MKTERYSVGRDCHEQKSRVERVWRNFWRTQNSPVWLRYSSAGKESTCNAGDTGLIPGLGRSAREGIGYPLQYFGASLVAQPVKNLPAMWETWVRSLGWEDPLEKGMAPHSSILAYTVHGVTKSQTRLRDFHFFWLRYSD